jgi:hypothetical protein
MSPPQARRAAAGRRNVAKSLAGRMGNVNLRGKKHKVMSCGCCICTDLRDKYREIEARKDIAEATTPQPTPAPGEPTEKE